MALTVLDPQTALVVIDLQKGIVSRQGVHPMADIVGNAAKLAKRFRALKLPVVLVNVAGRAPGRSEQQMAMGNLPPDWSDLAPELEQSPGDVLITKHAWGAFIRTSLEAELKKLNVTQVVMAGVSTSIGVESTARQAYELGFNVTLAIDAMTDMNADCHENSVKRIFPRLGETGTTAGVLALLDNRGA